MSLPISEKWLKQPLDSLKGVGPSLALKLSRLGLNQIGDVLWHLPLRYEDRSSIFQIAAIQAGSFAQFQGEIVHSEIRHGRKKILRCVLADDSGQITLTFFRFFPSQVKQLEMGARLLCSGDVKVGFQGGLECAHPKWKLIQKPLEEFNAPRTYTPVYPAGEGIQQSLLLQMSEQVLAKFQDFEFLPWDIDQHSKVERWLDFKTAVTQLHRPPLSIAAKQLTEKLEPARKRLALEECVAHALSLRKSRHTVQNDVAPQLKLSCEQQSGFLQQLPFEPTAAQQRVTAEIMADIARSRPMLRLVQGDVGSGKTLVAAWVALACVESGYQVALLAPTEVLAEQHFYSFQAWFGNMNIKVGRLSGRLKAREKNEALQAIRYEADIVIGTHALLEETVRFRALGLCIIDEQHRFGVHQRLSLRERSVQKQFVPHQLVMTATPIPRTLAMTAYADLDYSVVDELPPGRQAVETSVISNQRREAIIERIQHRCLQNEQVYWVCTLIENSEKIQAQAAEDTCELLQAQLPDLKIGLLHGRMKSEEKQAIMQAFKRGETHLLVATTVIEVGVDVANASLMIIENAERLGLAQLHQLRGRVGRGDRKSHCVLMYEAPLSETARSRLETMRASTDGFKIAEADLQLRGPGEMLGTRQKGSLQFKLVRLEDDQDLLEQASDLADHLLMHQPELAQNIQQRWYAHQEQYIEA